MTHDAIFRFYAELNTFLPQPRRNTPITHQFSGRVSIKDMIESIGVPHPEVEAIVAGQLSVDFNYLVQHGDQIDVYPPSALPTDIAIVPLRPLPPTPARFVLDTHLGQLAAYLRLLGFDTLYRNDYDDAELARVSSEETRILLTRDRGLLKRGIVTFGYFVRETDPQLQIAEIVERYQLARQLTPLRRCIRCNGMLRPVDKASISARLAPKTREFYNDFSVCAECDQIYWKGSHHERIQLFIDDLRAQLAPGD